MTVFESLKKKFSFPTLISRNSLIDKSVIIKQSSLIIANDASIETSQTVTLGDTANLIVVSPDVLESLFKYKRDGEIVQTQTYRIGGFGSYYYRDTYDGWPGIQMRIFDTKFTPRYSTSKIIIEYKIICQVQIFFSQHLFGYLKSKITKKQTKRFMLI